ncbi:MAG: hypothetical protein H7331_09130 [Bacteroidia bacterium]|nr:hypothetical protein [Bacteroidia bacterium]
MMKLYKRVDGELHFFETWDINDKTGALHKGIVGQHGEYKEIKSGVFSNFRKKIQIEIDSYCKDGYKEVDIDDYFTLLIEFTVEGIGTQRDLEKRTRLEAKMNETLGWVGLGHCDGGSIGSGTMEVCCFVIDFEIAKLVIEQDLKNTEFSNYRRIYLE